MGRRVGGAVESRPQGRRGLAGEQRGVLRARVVEVSHAADASRQQATTRRRRKHLVARSIAILESSSIEKSAAPPASTPTAA